MADLLECLIQIRALGETAPRLQRLLAACPPPAWQRPEPNGGPPPAERLAELVKQERAVARQLLTVFRCNAGEPLAQGEERAGVTSPHELVATFAALRNCTLGVLAARSAAELGAPLPGSPSNGPVLADLVARMVATDTQILGEIRAALEESAGTPEGGS